MADNDGVESAGAREGASALPALRKAFTRRGFIAGAGAAGAGYALRDALSGGAREIPRWVQAAATDPISKRTFTMRVYRREDMLRLRIDLHNLVPARDPNQFVKQDSSVDAYVTVHFPPQHVAEEAFLRAEGFNENLANNAVARAQMAGESRLVFRVPDAALPLTRSVPALLAWLEWVPRLVPQAVNPNQVAPAIVAPRRPIGNLLPDTALELPWRLVLSPLPTNTWIHRSRLVADTNRHELWHTRLARVRSERDENGVQTRFADETALRQIRAVWSLDPQRSPLKEAPTQHETDDDDPYKNNGPQPVDGDGDFRLREPFRAALSPRNRIQIVQNSSGFALSQHPNPEVEPIEVNRLMLSALGGFLDVHADWDNPASVALKSWRHRATMGRDNFVEVVEDGFFMPWGIPAVRFVTTERVDENRGGLQLKNVDSQATALLRQEVVYVVKNPVIEYPVNGQQDGGRRLPFRILRARTIKTPPVAEDVQTVQNARIPLLGSGFYPFGLEGEDWEGRRIRFRQPLAWVGGDTAISTVNMGAARISFNQLPLAHPLRQISVAGAKVAFASSDEPGDTTLETSTISFRVAAPGQPEPLQAKFVPEMERARARVKAAEVVTGKQLGPDGQELSYLPQYLTSGFGSANVAKTFLRFVTPTPLFFGETDKSGGLATPSMALTGISRTYGAIGGDVADQVAGLFKPALVFGDALDANLIGGIKLKDILPVSSPASENITLKTTENDVERVATLRWQPTIEGNDVLVPGLVHTDPDAEASFRLQAQVTQSVETNEVRNEVTGDLRNVTLQLLGSGPTHFIDVELKRLAFTSRTGTSPHVDVRLGEITFAGPLAFVNELREVLANQDGPVGVEVDGTGIRARAGLAIPSIGVGIFQFTHLAFNAEFGVPFDNRPVYAKFGISSQDSPFKVAVSCFGGGGWFAITLDAENGVREIEAGIEFGAVVAMDFGVAAASVELMVGIYFALEEGKVTLCGYARLTGELRVGFVSVGLVAEIQLCYVQKDGQKAIVTGRGTFTVEVPAAPDITIEIEKTFGGDPNDPRYVDQVSQLEWRQYCGAFAPEGV